MMVFEIEQSKIAIFIIYCVFSISLSKFVIRNLSIIYSSYGIYHYCRNNEFEENCDNEENTTKEPIDEKIRMVAGSNALAALVTTVVVLGFQFFSSSIDTVSSSLSVSLSLSTILALGVLATVFNTSLRLAAFGSPLRGTENIDEKRAINVRDTIIGFGFSFWSTLYFLLIIGVGIAILTGNPAFDMQGFEQSFSEMTVTAFIIFIVAPLVGSLISECSLYLLNIPNGCKECKDKS